MSLSISKFEKDDAFSRISKFMGPNESGVVLTGKEEKILTRWTLAHSLLAERKFTREEIAEKISKIHSVSLFTARSDIDNAYKLFISITKEYKQYTLWQSVEDIDKLINKWKDDKSLAALLPKLFAERTRAIAAMPLEAAAPNLPAPVIIVQTTGAINSPMAIDEALKEADKLIQFEKDHEYLDFEDSQDGETKEPS